MTATKERPQEWRDISRQIPSYTAFHRLMMEQLKGAYRAVQISRSRYNSLFKNPMHSVFKAQNIRSAQRAIKAHAEKSAKKNTTSAATELLQQYNLKCLVPIY